MSAHKQRGSVLIVSLVLLLVLTALAVSSVRDSALETQVMARSLELQRLFNAAEAGLREAERRITQSATPLPPCGATPCFQSMAIDSTVDFATATPYLESLAPNAVSVRWYIRQIPPAAGQVQDASYGTAARATGTLYYEVNSQAFFPDIAPSNLDRRCEAMAVCLRSVVARTFVEPTP